MEYFVDKIQMRIVRIKRDFSYIDKIGLLTNSFINEIEGTIGTRKNCHIFLKKWLFRPLKA
jgi:hypothetical protein